MSHPPPSDRFEAGRSDPPELLSDRLRRADPEYLRGAAENPSLDAELAVALLRNRGATPDLLARLSRDPRLRGSYEVRAAIVRHPKTPRSVSMNLVHHLFWRDLARTADDLTLPPPVRRLAIRLLEARLEELALGEQVTLARTGGRSVLLALRRSRDARIIEALLDNRHAVEDDAVFLAGGRETPGPILSLVGRHRRWGRRYGVRLALVHNVATPVGVALGLLTGLQRRDLEGIVGRADQRPVLQVAAERVLASRGGRRSDGEEVWELEAEPE